MIVRDLVGKKCPSRHKWLIMLLISQNVTEGVILSCFTLPKPDRSINHLMKDLKKIELNGMGLDRDYYWKLVSVLYFWIRSLESWFYNFIVHQYRPNIFECFKDLFFSLSICLATFSYSYEHWIKLSLSYNRIVKQLCDD